MSWLHNHATELTAIGSIFMDVATLVIIFFNLNQLRLNNRSLNVDINFKVFELRKNIYKDLSSFIKSLNHDKGFRAYLVEQESGEYKIKDTFDKLKGSIENSKHLFSGHFALELELLLLNIEQGIAIEQKTIKLKNKDSSAWSTDDHESLRELGQRRKEAITSISEFKIEQFLPYLNVSNFHKNLMQEELNMQPETWFCKFKNFGSALIDLIPRKKKLAY